MDLVLISSTKLKILLSPVDMAAYSLTCDNIDYDNTETRRAFWDILDVAKHKTGFDAASDRVFIQVYPLKSGGCEMYVTKLIKREENIQQDEIKLYEKKKNRYSPVSLSVENDPSEHNECDVYSFKEFYNMLDACRQLILRGYNKNSSIWIDENISRYYLTVEKNEEIPSCFLNEYGTRHSENTAYTYITEHCRCICKNKAAEMMASLV